MLEEGHDLEKIIENAKEYNWQAVPYIYMVEMFGESGNSKGYVPSLFIDKKEASKVAKRLHGVVIEVVGYDSCK